MWERARARGRARAVPVREDIQMHHTKASLFLSRNSLAPRAYLSSFASVPSKE